MQQDIVQCNCGERIDIKSIAYGQRFKCPKCAQLMEKVDKNAPPADDFRLRCGFHMGVKGLFLTALAFAPWQGKTGIERLLETFAIPANEFAVGDMIVLLVPLVGLVSLLLALFARGPIRGGTVAAMSFMVLGLLFIGLLTEFDEDAMVRDRQLQDQVGGQVWGSEYSVELEKETEMRGELINVSPFFKGATFDPHIMRNTIVFGFIWTCLLVLMTAGCKAVQSCPKHRGPRVLSIAPAFFALLSVAAFLVLCRVYDEGGASRSVFSIGISELKPMFGLLHYNDRLDAINPWVYIGTFSLFNVVMLMALFNISVGRLYSRAIIFLSSFALMCLPVWGMIYQGAKMAVDDVFVVRQAMLGPGHWVLTYYLVCGLAILGVADVVVRNIKGPRKGGLPMPEPEFND